MMCSCEKDFALKYFSHQIGNATELETRERIQVTLGFQNNICNSCKGLPEKPYPRAEIYGLSTKIRRYYWREIKIETVKRFGKWAYEQEYNDWLIALSKNKKKYKEIEKEVIKKIKKQHAQNPKYIFEKKPSRDEILRKYNVEIININTTYVKNKNRKVKIISNGIEVTAENFAKYYFEKKGYDVIEVESIPFHVIFGTFMWILIQDPRDIKNRIVMFGDRIAYEQKVQGKQIQTFLPEDYGTSGFYTRRKNDIQKHLDELARDDDDLLWLFDYWLYHSFKFRNYLWAHRDEDVEKAKILIQILGLDSIKKILHYMIKNYWDRYLGWPDLFIYNKNQYFFVEVKSSKDKLSDNQKNWIKGNYEELKFPFKLLKIHKKNTQQKSKAI